MKLEMKKTAPTLTVIIEGRIDMETAPELEEKLRSNWDDVTELILDLKAVDYISSAGLRVLLCAEKHMSGVGTMTVINVCNDVKEVFNMTGFNLLLHIE